MKSLIQWLVEFFNPCAHCWERVETLRDRPKNPTAATIVMMCTTCGEIRQETFKAPEAPAPLRIEPRCPPHLWETTSSTNIYPAGKNDKNSLPIGNNYMQKCKRCGELKDYAVRY